MINVRNAFAKVLNRPALIALYTAVAFVVLWLLPYGNALRYPFTQLSSYLWFVFTGTPFPPSEYFAPDWTVWVGMLMAALVLAVAASLVTQLVLRDEESREVAGFYAYTYLAYAVVCTIIPAANILYTFALAPMANAAVPVLLGTFLSLVQPSLESCLALLWWASLAVPTLLIIPLYRRHTGVVRRLFGITGVALRTLTSVLAVACALRAAYFLLGFNTLGMEANEAYAEVFMGFFLPDWGLIKSAVAAMVLASISQAFQFPLCGAVKHARTAALIILVISLTPVGDYLALIGLGFSLIPGA